MFVYADFGDNIVVSKSEECQEACRAKMPEEPQVQEKPKRAKLDYVRKSRIKNIFTQDTLVDVEWVAQLTEYAPSMISRWRQRPEEKFPKVVKYDGNKMLFDKKAVIIWLANKLRQPQLNLR